MRKILAERCGLRGTFTATYSRPGSRLSHGHEKPMLLFLDVQDAGGASVTDHVWFGRSDFWDKLNLKPGDRVRFVARVKAYTKGYIDKTTDYRLSNPSQGVVLNRATAQDPQQPDLFSEVEPGKTL